MKFLNISLQDKPLLNSIIKDIRKIINNTDFILGKSTKIFEDKFAKYCGAKYAVGCGNGTDALYLAIKSLELPKNSEVIVPAMSYCSTLFAVIEAGLKPVLVDIEKNSSTLSFEEAKKKINKKTKLIIPVHLYGQCCDYRKLKNLVKNRKIYIIEDAAQAHGGYDSNSKRKAGSIGDIGCFSFYPGKNLGAYGDAGAIVTNNFSLYKKILRLRNLGQIKKFDHNIIGVNSRLDTIQAAILIKKLNKLDDLNKKRKLIANFYNKKINNKKIFKLKYSDGCVFHQYVIITKNPTIFRKYLKFHKIPYGRHYPQSLNQMKAVKKLFKNQKFSNAEFLAKNGTSLPTNPLLKTPELKMICKTINKF